VIQQFQFTISHQHPALPGHFPGRPIVPGVLLLEHVLAGIASECGQRVERLRQVKFPAALLPDETAQVIFDACGDRVGFSVEVLRGGVHVTLATGSLLLGDAADLPAAVP
jgi:3-hydroxyacyl-[acyl-carrier-protein] dehydratase